MLVSYQRLQPDSGSSAFFPSTFPVIKPFYCGECYHICSKIIAKVISNKNRKKKPTDDLHFRMRCMEQLQGHETGKELVEGSLEDFESVSFGCWNANLSLRLGGIENVSVHCRMARRPCRNRFDHLRFWHTKHVVAQNASFSCNSPTRTTWGGKHVDWLINIFKNLHKPTTQA